MRKYRIFLLCLCAVFFLSSLQAGIPRGVRLDNGIVSAVIMPEASGSIVSLKSVFVPRDLFRPFEYRCEKSDLLPDMVTVSVYGMRGFLWGTTAMFNQKIKVASQWKNAEECGVLLTCGYYSGTEYALQRKIVLRKNESRIRIRTVLTNCAEKKQTARLWEHLYADPGNPITVIIPAAARSHAVGRARTVKNDYNGLVVSTTAKPLNSSFFSPYEPWIAVAGEGSPPVLLVQRGERSKILPDGMQYIFSAVGCQTAELVDSPVILNPGERYSSERELMVFSGLKSITGLCGDTASFLYYRGSCLFADFAVVSHVPEQTVRFCSGGRSVSVHVPSLAPGVLYSVPLQTEGKWDLRKIEMESSLEKKDR